MIYHKIQITIKQDSYTKANESGEEAEKETMRLIDIGLPQSKNKVNTVTLQLHADLSVYFRNGHNRWILYLEGSIYSSDFPFESARFDSV